MDGGAHRMRKCSVISQAGLQVSEFAVLSKLGLLLAGVFASIAGIDPAGSRKHVGACGTIAAA
ncbi:hypothetical protein CHY08_31145 (plasmid) [Rhizobium leguminosarum bv. viciae]|nr:hypothetical protein CHY08_31145 [Rhizobium leguminosarum bv. viciae]